jgi:hypothetical protein
MKISTLQEAKQAAFNGAYRGLSYQQWQPSLDPSNLFGDRCSYYSKDGKHCGVGWLIPKHKYNPDIERRGAGELLVTACLADPFQDFLTNAESTDRRKFLVFLDDLQVAHDDLDATCSMKERMHNLAESEGLSIPKPLRA